MIIKFLKDFFKQILGVSCLLIAANVTALHAEQKMAIPAYFYPGPLWSQLESAAPTVGLAVMNPASGPGSGHGGGSGRYINPDYARAVANAKAQGIKVIGYVHTSYGTRSKSEVMSEINNYYFWYGVDGIFLDEADASCQPRPNKNYYKDLYLYIKSKRGANLVVLNPGVRAAEYCMSVTDILVNFEGAFKRPSTDTNPHNFYYNESWAPGWEIHYQPNRFWHLVYDTSESDTDGDSIGDMPHAIQLSKDRNAGWVYVTSDTLPNPWDTLPDPSYWSHELTCIIDSTSPGC
jgi:hypothetical protein